MEWIIITILIVSIFRAIYIVIKKSKQIESLNSELIKKISELSEEKKKEKTILFGIITKPWEKDINILMKNQEALDIVIKILHYEIFKKTDITRWRDNSEIDRNIWGLNMLHELNLKFAKIKNWINSSNDDEE